MGRDSLGDGPYGIALIYRADCNLNQAHGAQFAARAARVAAYERLGVRTYWIVNPDPPEPGKHSGPALGVAVCRGPLDRQMDPGGAWW